MFIENARIRIGNLNLTAAILIFVFSFVAAPLRAQDDFTTQHASSALDGGWITGPASNPLSFLNGPANRTYGSKLPYDFPNFRPVSYLDARLPKWLNLEAEERFRYEGYENSSFKQGSDDSYLLNRFRFQADLRFGSWFKVVSQVQDARPILQNPPIGPPNEDRWDLKLAYAEIGSPDKHWFSLRVGRQLINYNNTLIADSQWRNQGRSYDAAVANLQGGRYHLGIFAASAVVPQASGVSPHQEGNNIYGLYGRVENPIPKSSFEPFVLWRVQPSLAVEPGLSKTTGKEDMQTYGVRLKGRVHDGLNYSVESAGQVGSVGAETFRAWSLTGGTSYEFNVRTDPRIFAQYDFASGNPTPGDGTHRTFDTLYPTAHDRFGLVDLFGWQNIRAVREGGTFMPHRRLSVSGQYLDFWVDSTSDAVYNTSGGAIFHGKVTPGTGTYLGQEFDFYSWYELNSHFNIGGGYGRFDGGSFLSQLTTGHVYPYSYIALNFKDHGRGKGE
ncbi:MAG: alginate export family protein [Terracidiphilus sp.]